MHAAGTKRSLQSFSRDALRRWRHDHSSQPNPFHTLHFSSSTSTTKFSPALRSLKKKLAVGALPTIHRTAKAFKSYAETCASLLRQCADRHPLALGPALHAHTIKSGVSADHSISTKLLTMYSNWGWVAYRDRVFGEADGFDLFSWNYMIAAYARCGDLGAARHLFDRMPERNVVTWTVMVDGHMKCGKVQESIEYFERNPFRTVISWTAMICGFVQNGLYFDALLIFHRMLESSLMPNEVTFTSVVRACIGAGEFDLGKSIVGLIIKTNFERNLSVCNSLITLYLRMGDVDLARRVFDEMEERDVVSWTVLLDVYAQIGDLVEARRIFDEMPERNEVSWSTMIARYSQNGEALEALRMFYHMLHDGYRPNVSCFSSALSASSNLENLLFGSNVHCHAIKVGFDSDVYVASSLIDMYFRCGKLIDGHQVFDLLPEKNMVCWNSMIAGLCYNGKMEEAEELFKNMLVKNVVSWNAIISGYAQNERYSKVLETFDDMLMSGQTPSQMTFSSVLHACANLSSLEKGKNLHAKILKLGIQDEVFMGTALIDMYAKSGDIESSKKVFCRMPEKNEISWTAMIQGLADNGFAEESIILFEEMKKIAIVPTEAIFLSVLFACSHCGLVDKGFHYFESMKKVYGIMPKEKHYTCMVDLLARAGHLREAEELISMMPVQPEANSWAALLSACSTYGDEEIGERAAKKLWESEKNNSAGYVLLANLYASCRRWKDAAKVRTLMKKTGLKKGGGCSWIQIKDQFHTFFSWDVKHQKSSEIYGVLQLLTSEMMA